jgi:hypothetical protein
MEFADLICHKSVIFLRCCMTFLKDGLKSACTFLYYIFLDHET